MKLGSRALKKTKCLSKKGNTNETTSNTVTAWKKAFRNAVGKRELSDLLDALVAWINDRNVQRCLVQALMILKVQLLPHPRILFSWPTHDLASSCDLMCRLSLITKLQKAVAVPTPFQEKLSG